MEKFNFIDINGELTCPGVWIDRCYEFYNGFAIVSTSDGCSFIDTDYRLIGDGNQWFDGCGKFNGGFATVISNNQCSFIDTNGRLIGDGKLWFDRCKDFHEGFAAVKSNNKWSFIDTNGKLIGDGNQWYDQCWNFNDGYALVGSGNKWSYLSTNGNLFDTKEEAQQDSKKNMNGLNVQAEDVEMWGGPAIKFSISEDRYFVLIGPFDETPNWHLHFENDGDIPYSVEEKDALRKAVAKYIKSGETVSSFGGATPGGLSGMKALAEYGFDVIGQYSGKRLYWSSDRLLDKNKFEEWIKNPKHENDFKIIDKNKPISKENTRPIIVVLKKK